MKKKILLGIGAVALFVTLALNASLGITGSNAKMGAVTLANVEALAKSDWEFWACAMTSAEHCVTDSELGDIKGDRMGK
jgi:hypothetical protein